LVTQNWKYIDLEDPNDFERVTNDPLFFFKQFPNHIILDEAQAYPELFNILRGVIDSERQQKGRFIITGSASPELYKYASDSLAGRIAIIELGPFKANEYAGEIDEKTVREYMQIATGTFLWRSLPSFEKDVLKAVIKMPKGYLCSRASAALWHAH
jgi:predicted AAA+ superfamily ATPase